MAASEIILNFDQSVYHLHLKNGDVPSKVITVGDPERVDMLLPFFDQIDFDQQHREFRSVKGKIGTEELLIISTGIGTDNIDIVLNELHLAYAWDLAGRFALKKAPKKMEVLRLGTSGTLQSDIPLDSILMSESALGFDYLMYYYQWQDYRKMQGLNDLPSPYFAKASIMMQLRFTGMIDFAGVTVTANGFYGPQGRNSPLESKNPNWLNILAKQTIEGRRITNLEMETAGIYALGSLLNMNCLSLSAILANRQLGTFSKEPEITIKKMIRAALEIFIEPR